MNDGRLQVCYVVVGDGWSRFAQMAWLSAHTVRLHEPSAKIILVTDERSYPTIEASASRLLSSVDETVKVMTEIEDKRNRSFFLKTALRRHISGDLLYLDADTLVIGSLADIPINDAEVAAALDFNYDGEWFPPGLREPYRALGWQYPLPCYFNSGVLFLRDTPAVREFSEEWTRRWFSLLRIGTYLDQDAFVSALYASPVRWCILPKSFNAITVKRNYRFKESRVLHFFGSEVEQGGTIMEYLLQQLRETGAFDEDAYLRCLREHHPWGPNPEAYQLWHSRNYVRAALLKCRRTLSRILARRSRSHSIK